MRLGVVRGTIERRILLNWRVEPNVLARLLPEPFEPRVVHGWGIAGVCLIRLNHLRPSFVPHFLGMKSENSAHRIAVQWMQDGERKQGVYVHRRDTDSPLNALAGGRIFAGTHHRARFQVSEEGARFAVDMQSLDGQSSLSLVGWRAPALSPGSTFRSLEEASRFFETGSLGWSPTGEPNCFEGLELVTLGWSVQPLEVERVRSSLFDDRGAFPAGSLAFDSALLMEDVAHEWHRRGVLRDERVVAAALAP
jgi:hypothetical protein